MDGRKRRWHQHKVERRNELVDGTIDAIRRLGGALSMDEIAAFLSESKSGATVTADAGLSATGGGLGFAAR